MLLSRKPKPQFFLLTLIKTDQQRKFWSRNNMHKRQHWSLSEDVDIYNCMLK